MTDPLQNVARRDSDLIPFDSRVVQGFVTKADLKLIQFAAMAKTWRQLSTTPITAKPG